LEGENSDADRFIRNWFYELNRRVAIIHYLAEIKGGVQPGVEELFDFCMDDKAEQLILENDKFMGFPLALNTLKRALMYRPNLNTVCFSGIEIDDEVAIIIAEIIHHSEFIKTLELPHNKITPEGADALAASLRFNTSITALDMSHNPLKDKGVTKLARVLPDHANLKKLALSGTGMTDAGVLELCKGLRESEKKNGKIHPFPSMDLGFNQISDTGALAIRDICMANSTIGILELERNMITDHGAAALAGIVDEKSKSQVTIINLAENQLSSVGLESLAEALKRSYYALSIDVSHNPLIGRSGIAAVAHPDLSLDWILLKVRSQTSGVAASNLPPDARAAKARTEAKDKERAKATKS
jgi:hypothetical protein